MFKDYINNFPKQFEWRPEIENAEKLLPKEKVIVLGMGGSHLAADLARTWTPYWGKILVHSDYGLPALSESDLKQSLVIAFSHSGDTEEIIDGFSEAQEKGLAVAAISGGGKLIELARGNSAPHILLPDSNIPPRMALGFHFRAILKIMGEEKTLAETKELAGALKSEEFKTLGRELAQKLKNHVPVIYSSASKFPTAQIWKVKLNETVKIPAFANAVPELNHNEMAGFDVSAASRELAGKFSFIILEDSYDHPKNQGRLAALAEILEVKGFDVERIQLQGQNHWYKIFSDLMLADWTSYHLAELYGVDPENVPIVEDFKKKLAS